MKDMSLRIFSIFILSDSLYFFLTVFKNLFNFENLKYSFHLFLYHKLLTVKQNFEYFQWLKKNVKQLKRNTKN